MGDDWAGDKTTFCMGNMAIVITTELGDVDQE